MSNASRHRIVVEESSEIARWLLGVACVLAFVVFFTLVQAFQVTSKSTAQPTLRRSIASLTEIDTLIERGHDDMKARAETIDPGEMVELRDFPVSVPLGRDEALSATPDELRSQLLDGAVAAAYDDGSDVFREEGATSGAGRFTAAGLIERTLGFLRDDVHAMIGLLVLVAGAVCLLLVGWLSALCRGFGRVAAAGWVTLAAAAPVLAAGWFARFSAQTADDAGSEYVRRELLAIGDNLAWIAIRNGSAFAALGLALLVIAWAGSRLSDRRAHIAEISG